MVASLGQELFDLVGRKNFAFCFFRRFFGFHKLIKFKQSNELGQGLLLGALLLEGLDFGQLRFSCRSLTKLRLALWVFLQLGQLHLFCLLHLCRMAFKIYVDPFDVFLELAVVGEFEFLSVKRIQLLLYLCLNFLLYPLLAHESHFFQALINRSKWLDCLLDVRGK